MKDRVSLHYRLFVSGMVLTLVAGLVHTDRSYRAQTDAFLRSNVTTVARVDFPQDPLPPLDPAPDTAASDQVNARSSHGLELKPDFFAQRLLASFADAQVMESDETVEPDGLLLKRDVLLTEEKYPLITREIRYSYDEGQGIWVPVKGTAWVADQVLVGLNEGQGLEALQSILEDMDAELVQNVREENHFLIRFRHADPDGLDEKISQLSLYGFVAYAEPNYFRVSTDTPNDTSFNNLWALNNLGSGSGNYDADIDAVEAWETTSGDPNVLVAVIDTGVQVDHPDLIGRVYYNLLEQENGIDDDGNGFVDDIHGWNFYELNQGNNDVRDTETSHGTHVAGIIAATGNNGKGVVGVSPGITVLPVKIFNDNGGFASDLIRGMDYALRMGASIMNISLGGSSSSRAEIAMIDELEHHGVLLVVSSGNSGNNIDVNKSFPSCYPNDNIIAVAASNWFDELEDYSSYGAVAVDVLAPGTGILSTTAMNSYAYYSGTSMAAPHVTGVAALVKSVRTDWNSSMLREAIFSTLDPVDSAVGKTSTGGRVNANAAVIFARENTFFPNGLHIRIKSAVNGLYVNPRSLGHSKQLIADGAVAGLAQTFEVVQVDESTYALRSVENGLYVTVEAGGLEPLSATRDAISDWELFYPINLGNGGYAFRAKANGKVVTAEHEGADALIANRDTVGAWETFEIETLHLLPVGKMIVLQSAVSGLFVSPRVDGVLVPSETVAGLRNIFSVELSMDGFLTLKSYETGEYVSAHTEGSIPLQANRDAVGDWEKFVAIAHESGHLLLRCKANGLFVSGASHGTAPLVANRSEIMSEELFNFYLVK